ncbi:MAG: ankyrin repeat domain-containing protein [Candidatus Zixiibacteriota bacterium]|nr:MAG: ankyrin repeat domain-containing protein [candidate division Zixibacteria bacterium]
MRRILLLTGTAFLAVSVVWAGQIHNAAEQGNLETVRTLLESDASLLNSRLENGQTPLHRAAYTGQTEVAGFLLAKGADVNARTNSGSTPLHGAAYYGHPEAAQLLIEAGVDINAANNYGYVALLSAAAGGRADIVELLLSKGADVHPPTYLGANAVLSAAAAGCKETFDVVVAAGADINAVDNNGENLLHYAAAGGNLAIIETALNRGIDVNAPDSQKNTPIFNAVENSHPEALGLLIDRGAEVNMRNASSLTPLHHAALASHVEGMDSVAFEMSRVLIEKGADVNIRDQWGTTPFDRVIATNNAALFRLLVDYVDDVNAPDINGVTPLLRAVTQSRPEFVRALLQSEARTDLCDNNEKATVLHVAVAKGNSEIVELLLPHVENLDAADRLGNTPLYYAMNHGHRQIAQMLTSAGAKAPNIKGHYSPSPLLDEPLGKGEAVLWYTGHCGWAVKTQNHFLLFDYWERDTPTEPCLANGHVSPDELAGQNLEVFVSHEHGDHFDPATFTWQDKIPNMTCYFGFRPEELPEENRQGYDGQEYVYVGPRQQMTSDGMAIQTIRANDAGVGFVVDVDGLSLYFAGDHAGWREGQRDGFMAEIDYLAERVDNIDFAFVNVTGCHAGDTLALAEATFYTLEKLAPKIMVPTHGIDREYVYRQFASKVAAQGFDLPVLCARVRGDRFVFKEDRIL